MGLSGYFIMRSWHRDPNLWRFWVRRLLRIMPGLLVVLALSALILGTLTTTLGKRAYLAHPATWDYISDNLLLFPQQYVLPGVFTANPYPSAVNGSLWSLPVELLGYTLIALLGLLITFSRFRFVMVVFALAMAVLLQRMVDRADHAAAGPAAGADVPAAAVPGHVRGGRGDLALPRPAAAELVRRAAVRGHRLHAVLVVDGRDRRGSSRCRTW